jgi:hypothetical protein
MADRDLDSLTETILALPAEQRAALLRAVPLPAPTRYELVREIRRRFYPSHSVRAASVTIEDLWNEYAACAWPHDRSAVTCPPRHVGKPQELLWQIMRDWPNTLSRHRIRQILAG